MKINSLWYICLLVRIILILFIRFSKYNITFMLFTISLGFMFKAITGSNDEIQIDKVFWHTSRIFHSILYLLATITLFYKKKNVNSLLLSIDILFSIFYRIYNNV